MLDGEGEVAARLLEDAAYGVGGAAEAAGHRVRVVDGDEDGVHLVHGAEPDFAFGNVAGAEGIQEVAAELADSFAHAVEVGGQLDIERLG